MVGASWWESLCRVNGGGGGGGGVGGRGGSADVDGNADEGENG